MNKLKKTQTHTIFIIGVILSLITGLFPSFACAYSINLIKDDDVDSFRFTA